jgi:PhzF family phenazine biosynthesis protein
MNIQIYQVDAFHHELFKGNPAAVCPLEEWLPSELMQDIAMENNLSETAFIVKVQAGYEIRWFTPLSEVDLCGHATLASAHVLFNHLSYERDTIEFFSASGILYVKRREDGRIYMDFPAHKPRKVKNKEIFGEAMGKQPNIALRAKKLMLVYEDEEEILKLSPDFKLVEGLNDIGVIATAPGRDFDFVSRFFAPAVGINEDPVTGSAHTHLIPYWSAVLNKKYLSAWQCSKRGGILLCENHNDRVLIGGHAVTYMDGYIQVQIL